MSLLVKANIPFSYQYDDHKRINYHKSSTVCLVSVKQSMPGD